MPRKHHSMHNVPMTKTLDPEGRTTIDSRGVQTTFDEDGTLTFNMNNGILVWNSGDITHMNFTSNDFMIIFDAESNILTLTSKDKNICYDLDKLKAEIEAKGLTTDEMDAALEQLNNTENKEKET